LTLCYRYFPKAIIDTGLKPFAAVLGQSMQGLQVNVARLKAALLKHTSRIYLFELRLSLPNDLQHQLRLPGELPVGYCKLALCLAVHPDELQ
jgi:hypothetical protein